MDFPESSNQSPLPMLGLILASLLVSIGTYWSFSRGGNDFTVFYTAWQHVLQGQPMEIYSVSPDRFLYAPGFAWLFAPFALLPRGVALAIWCFAKAALIGWMVREFARVLLPRVGNQRIRAAGLVAWGLVLLARPVLIDFQYGQVNLLILGACVWGLLNHTSSGESSSPWSDLLSWVVVAIAAVGKLFPLPLLSVPFFVTSFGGRDVPSGKLWRERAGVLIGMALILLMPLVSVSGPHWVALFRQWQEALVSRGFPLESHNQSFAAFLQHYTSGQPTEIIFLHRRKLSLGLALFSQETIELLSLAWSFLFAGLILTWILLRSGSPRLIRLSEREGWVAILVGLLILPSHLVWKPYFVMGLPAAFIAVRSLPRRWPGLLAIFLFINFSGFDFLGSVWGARFEAACILLWCHLALLFLISSTRRDAMISDIRP